MLSKFSVALLIALISGLGVGGGGLFAVYLSMCTDTPQLSVQGFNLLFFIFCAASSVCVQLFKRKIMFKVVSIMAISGVLGALGGSMLAAFVKEELLRKIFGVMLVGTGIISLRNSPKNKKGTDKRSK